MTAAFRVRSSVRALVCSMLLLALSSCDGCEGCGAGDGLLATLMAVQGGGAKRDFAASPRQWQVADLGAEFRLGDGVRTEKDGNATLRLADGTQLNLVPSTLVRFMTDTDEEQRLAVETGAAILTVGDGGFRLQTDLGVAVIQGGTRLVLRNEDGTLRYQVEVGGARFGGAPGTDAFELRAGEQYEVGIGKAVFGGAAEPESEPEPVDAGAQERGPADMVFDDDPGGDAPDGEDDDQGDDEAAGGGGPKGVPGLGRTSLTLRAGASVTIHAVDGLVNVGVDLSRACPGGGVVHLTAGKERYHGSGSVGVPVPVGAGAYTVRCIRNGEVQKRIVARGRLQVLRDAGTRELPRRPPTSRIDADGRTYNVFYQNQRPNIIVRWPQAPAAKSYTLDINGQTRDVPAAEYTFRSGKLADGTHRISFAAAGRKSRPATIVVRFDNAASTASLTAPQDRGFAAGATVGVAGIALAGWKVSAEGGTIEMDEGHRFTGQVSTSAARPDIALRLTHPRLGTHYYIRRAR